LRGNDGAAKEEHVAMAERGRGGVK
jgi:hypothetical protein